MVFAGTPRGTSTPGWEPGSYNLFYENYTVQYSLFCFFNVFHSVGRVNNLLPLPLCPYYMFAVNPQQLITEAITHTTTVPLAVKRVGAARNPDVKMSAKN